MDGQSGKIRGQPTPVDPSYKFHHVKLSLPL